MELYVRYGPALCVGRCYEQLCTENEQLPPLLEHGQAASAGVTPLRRSIARA